MIDHRKTDPTGSDFYRSRKIPWQKVAVAIGSGLGAAVIYWTNRQTEPKGEPSVPPAVLQRLDNIDNRLADLKESITALSQSQKENSGRVVEVIKERTNAIRDELEDLAIDSKDRDAGLVSIINNMEKKSRPSRRERD